MIKVIICKIKNHEFVSSGSCPFTGKTYKVCIRCEKMVANE